MAPAVGLFYGGMVRTKNLISMITLAFVVFAIVTIQWVTVGYSLAFGSDIAGLIGGLDYFFLEGIGTEGMEYKISFSWYSSSSLQVLHSQL
ncbi:hypothetical protein [Methanohalophilus sp.]